jgi:hypothetical protein
MKPSRWCVVVGLLWSIVVFGAVNWVALARRADCFDCGFGRGVPFVLFYDAGFPFFPARIDWTGLLADMLVVILSSFLLAFLIHMAYIRLGSAK